MSARRKQKRAAGKTDSLDKIIGELREKYDPEVIQVASSVKPVARLSTGLAKLDRIIGGGWPMGRITEIWGPQSSGKSSLLYVSIAHLQRTNPEAKIAYFDQENTLDVQWAQTLGVDLGRMLHVRAMAADDVIRLVTKLIRRRWDLCIVDSVVELLPEKYLKREVGEGQTYAPVAQVLSQFLPKVVVMQSSSPTTLILVNQVRDKIGFYAGAGQKAPGGQALFHLDSLKLRVQRREWIEKGDKKIGYRMSIRVIKSKVGQEQKATTLDMIFGKGIVEGD